jgi:Protein of unknown function (DUF3748)
MGVSPFYAVLLLGVGFARAASTGSPVEEKQLTSSPQGHTLTNTAIWSSDSEWIIYDLRQTQEKFDGPRIEAVNVKTGEVRSLYESKNGAFCGVATWHPSEPKAIFILGPENPTAEWSYASTHRRGLTIDLRAPGKSGPLDAMSYAPPFTPWHPPRWFICLKNSSPI